MHRIRFNKPQPAYRAEIQNSERLLVRRKEYAKVLASLIHEGVSIIYMDESTVNVWMRQSKLWQQMDSPCNVPLNNKRHKGKYVALLNVLQVSLCTERLETASNRR